MHGGSPAQGPSGIQIQPPDWGAVKKTTTGLVNEYVVWGSWGNIHGPPFIIWEELPKRVHSGLPFCGRGSFDLVNHMETAK